MLEVLLKFPTAVIDLLLNKVTNIVYNFIYDVTIYEVPIILVLRCSRGHCLTVYDVPIYDVNIFFHKKYVGKIFDWFLHLYSLPEVGVTVSSDGNNRIILFMSVSDLDIWKYNNRIFLTGTVTYLYVVIWDWCFVIQEIFSNYKTIINKTSVN